MKTRCAGSSRGDATHLLLRSPSLAAILLLAVACGEQEAAPNPPPTPASTTAAEASPAPQAPAPGKDACKVVSLEAVKTTTGVDAEGVPSKSGGADVCTWTSAQGKSAIVQIYPTASRFEQSRVAFEGLYGTKSRDLSGVGDKAFQIAGKTGPIQTATVSAQKGATAISVQVMGMDGSPETLMTEALALTNSTLGSLP